jgi:hypothetical protein
MKQLHRILLAAFLSVAAIAPALSGDHKKGDIENTVGPMSEPVLRARLKNLGYSGIKIDMTNPLRYRIEATRGGKPIAMHLHPQTGHMVELGPDEKPLRAWHMPIEAQETGPRKPK